MRAAPSELAAIIVAVTAFGCSTTRIQPHHLDDPAALIGDTIQLDTPDGHHETIVVTRVEGTTVTGHRPSDSASAVRPAEELTFDLRTIVGPEGSRVPTESASPSAVPTPPPSAEVASRHERWWLAVWVGDTVRLETKQGRTEVVIVTSVERTRITGYRPTDPVSAVRGPDELTFQFDEVETLVVDRSGRSGKTAGKVAATVIAAGVAKALVGVALGLLVVLGAIL